MKDKKTFITTGWRTVLVWVGLISIWIGNTIPPEYGAGYIKTIQGVEYFVQDPEPVQWYVNLLYVIGVAFTMTGCYIWTKLKKRHWTFMFWGLISPLGLLGLKLLKDKSVNPQAEGLDNL